MQINPIQPGIGFKKCKNDTARKKTNPKMAFVAPRRIGKTK